MISTLPVSARRHMQRGSALLIVFVFAAILAITLYTEMPVIVFEAQRNKEQLLMDRGNEYSQAVKIFLRKNHTYPASIAALENTNRIRYLRKKFKDPFTDKDDWRLLHAGPNGMLMDSKLKINQIATGTGTGAGNGALGTFNTNGQSSPFGGTSPGNSTFNSGFNSNTNQGFNSPSNSSNSGGFGSNSGGFNSNNNGFGFNANTPRAANDSQPRVGAAMPSQGFDNSTIQAGIAPNPDGSGLNGSNPIGSRAIVGRGQQTAGTNGTALGVVDPSQPQQQSGGFGTSASTTNNNGNPNTSVGGLFSNPNPSNAQTNGFNTGSGPSAGFGNNSFGSNSGANSGTFSNGAFGSAKSSTFGQVQGGGNFAGVASKVERHSIKTYNDQQDYSLWEFYYDPTKDPQLNAAGAAIAQQGGNGVAGSAPGIGQPGTQNNQSNPFGTNNQSSPFGNSTSSFGNSGPNAGAGAGIGSGFDRFNSQSQGNQNQTYQNPSIGNQNAPTQPPSSPPPQ